MTPRTSAQSRCDFRDIVQKFHKTLWQGTILSDYKSLTRIETLAVKATIGYIARAACLYVAVFIASSGVLVAESGDSPAAIDASSVRASHQRAIERGPSGAFAIPRDLDGAMLGFRGALPASHLRALERGPGGAFAIGGQSIYKRAE